MATPSGLAAQIGFKSESTVGTAVTVDQFHAGFVSEAIKQEIARIESAGLRAGRRTTHAWKPGAKTVGGSLTLELWDEPLATLLTHMFGTVNTTGAAAPYTHTATPGTLTGNSLTLQVGRPDIGGTVRAFTYAGVKIPSWTLSGSVGEIPQLQLDISAYSEVTDVELASASYPTAAPFVFTEGSLSIGGSAVAVIQEMSLEANNGLAVDRHRFNAATIREQLENGIREYTGSLTADFEDLTAYNRFVNGDEVAQVMKFDNGTDSLTITTNTRYDGETPEVSGPEQLTQPLPFKAISGTSDADAITAVLVNAEDSAA